MPAAKNPAAKAMNSPTMGSRRSVREPIGFTPAKKETPAPPPMRTPPPKMAPGERIMPPPSNPREVFATQPKQTPPPKQAPAVMPGGGRGMGNYVVPPPGEMRLMVDPVPPTGRGFKPGQGPGMGPPPAPPARTTPPRQMQPDMEYALGKSPVKPPVKSPGGAVRKISAKY